MSKRLGPVGPRGLTLLAAAGVVGLVLALHGWAHRETGGALGSLGRAPVSVPVSPTSTAGATTPLSAAPSAPTGAPSAAGTPGPFLTSQPFAQYSFVVWPGAPSPAAKAALTGLSVSVRRQSAGLSVVAAVNGQRADPAQFYPKGARVYVLEATMGDDSGNADFNLGDDGIVVTDAQGRIVS